MEVSEQSRIFDEWLSQHKGLLFKVVHAYGFTRTIARICSRKSRPQIWNSIPSVFARVGRHDLALPRSA